MRLSYYIHLGYGKTFLAHMRIKPWSLGFLAVYSTPRPGTNSNKSASVNLPEVDCLLTCDHYTFNWFFLKVRHWNGVLIMSFSTLVIAFVQHTMSGFEPMTGPGLYCLSNNLFFRTSDFLLLVTAKRQCYITLYFHIPLNRNTEDWMSIK